MASRKIPSRRGKKSPARKSKISHRPFAQTSRKQHADFDLFRNAITKLGSKIVARITGARENQIEKWMREKEVPIGYGKYDVELSLTLRRLSYMRNRAAKVANVSANSRTVYFEEYLELASKSRPTHSENARIVQILLQLGIDPHRPQSYLLGAT